MTIFAGTAGPLRIVRARLFRRRGVLLIVGIVAIAAVACGGDDSSPAASVAGTSSSAAGSSGPATNQEIIDNLPFDFDIGVYQGADVVGGTQVKFSDIVAQGKPVVLNAWAGLCPPCRAEMPDLQAAHEQFSDHIILFGLDVGPQTNLGNKDDALELIEEIGVTYPAGNTDTARIVVEWKILNMPSTFFVKPNGEVLRKYTGLLTSSELNRLVTELIAAS